MNYSFEYIDIILLAMIAGFIFLRLRGILGKRTGFEGKAPPQYQEILNNIAPKIELNLLWLRNFSNVYIPNPPKDKWKIKYQNHGTPKLLNQSIK